MMRTFALLGLCLLAARARAQSEPAEVLTALSLSQAVSRAVARNAQALLAAERIAEAELKRKSARGRFGPLLNFDASLQVWNKPLDVSFELPAGIPFQVPPMRARDTVTGTLQVMLIQPLTQIYQAYQGYRMTVLGRRAATIGRTQLQQVLAAETAKVYIGLRQGQAGLAVARTAVDQLKAQVQQAQAFLRAGVIEKNDLLKIQVALARSEENVIRAEAGVALARTALALMVGLPRHHAVDAVERFADPPPALGDSLPACVQRAYGQRPELTLHRATTSIHERARSLAGFALWPQVSIMATYQHAEGMGFFQPKDSFFFGASLKWTVWDWGATYYSWQESKSKVRQAHHELTALQDRIYLEVKQAYLELGVAQKSLRVADQAVVQAEEAFRVEQAKYRRQSSTTTELLDAQLSLTRARLARNTALYGYYLARTALSKAMGQPQS